MKNVVAIFTSALGLVMFIASGLCGALSGILLGWSFHGSEPPPLHWMLILFVAFLALFPAGTAGLLRVPWWLSPIVFSVPLLFLILSVGHWTRVLVATPFIAIAFAGGRLFRPRVVR